MAKYSSILSDNSSTLLIIIGLLLISAGGLSYTIIHPVLSPFGIVMITTGVILFLQSVRGFRVSNYLHFILILIIVNTLVIFVDIWPLQFAFSQASAGVLTFLGVSSTLSIQPHFGGVQIQIFVQSAISGYLVGGEIDNACAGIPVLLSCLFLVFLSDEKPPPPPARLSIALFAAFIVIMGDFIRILVELWLPAIGVAPFVIVHYPLAFVLGLSGVIAIAIAGQRWTNPNEGKTSS